MKTYGDVGASRRSLRNAHAGIPALGPAHVQAPSGQVDVVPAQRHDLRGSEAVAVGNWFTEGFDTLDLKEAKALLDDLA